MTRARRSIQTAAVTTLPTLLIALTLYRPVYALEAEAARQTAPIRIAMKPDPPFIERGKDQELINFDVLLTNSGVKTYQLVAIRLKVFDRAGAFELQREINENGRPPALQIIGERVLKPGQTIDLFQPFYEFDNAVDLSRMQLEFLFMEEGRRAPPVVIEADIAISIEVIPRPYRPAAYLLPLRGLLLIHDGHDFYSHHRRYSLASRYVNKPETAVSANLYAYDFVKTTSDGTLFIGDPSHKESWLTYGEPIFAPASGRVLEAVSDLPENTFTAAGEAVSFTDEESRDPMGFGNYVKILHADGRVSWLLHMRPASIRVKAGQDVAPGQLLGNVGFSGDSLFPHLHYTVTLGKDYPSQGAPTYFKNFWRVVGKRRLLIIQGQIDTGDLVEEGPK